jgi:deoxyhypusine synthase
LKKSYQIDPKDSWLLAAAEKNLPIFVPGWEDSTLGNMYAGHCISGDVKNVHTVRTGIEYMMELAEWYTNTTAENPLGFFQIAGGIAGDFPICVVPMLHQDLQREQVMALIRARCRMRRSPGVSWARRRRSSLSNRMHRLLHR